MTEAQNIDDLLSDATPSEPTAKAEPAQGAVVETGDKQSAVPPTDATEPATRDDAPHVPRKALEDERRKRQELERQLAEYQTKTTQQQPQQPKQQAQPQQQQPVITQEELERLWWENPAQAAAIVQHYAAQAAIEHAHRQAELAVVNRELNRSERRAKKTHGEEIVAAATQEALKLGKQADFIDEDDPYEALVSWYNDLQAARDPQSLKEKLRAELMAEMGITSPTQAPAKSKAPVPRSLASVASGQPRDERGRFNGPTPLEDIIG